MVHVAIIGAYGSAGVAVADSLLDEADTEIELTLIDDADPGGGLCILEGCMPSKEVLSAAAHRYQARHDHRLTGVPEVDLESVVRTKNEHIGGFAEHRRGHVNELADRENVTFIRERARFLDDRTLAAGDHTLKPDYIVIATGSSVNVPALPGIDDVEFSTSAEVLDRTEFGDTGLVMGFGYIGLELVPYLSEAAGMELTVIEHDDYPLDEMEAAYGETLLELYREDFGIEILTNTDEQALEATADGGVRLTVERGGSEGEGESGGEGEDGDGNESQTATLEADELFLFTGRRPTLEGLGLENTPLEAKQGWVASTMQAVANERVFVVGDANGKEPILHVAKEQGFVAADNILAHHRGESLEPYTNIPHHVIFSGLGVYPFARIGHTPATVAETDIDAVVVTREAADDGVFKTKNHPEGRATLIVDADDGTVLGYQALHYHADVMAKTMQVVIEMGLDVRDLPDRAYHPTTPEILDGLFREAAAQVTQ